ncbi:MAG: HAD-IA family hydrolase [Myxococcota bacterium]
MKTFHAWIFDLDGTLTVPMHDFAALKRELGLPADLDVLAGIASRAPEEQAPLREAVRIWELAHLDRAEAGTGARELLTRLREARIPMGIVTRNTHEGARGTLKQIGLSELFDDAVIYGREDAKPKPAPDAVLALLERFSVAADQAVMIGDDIHDLQAARAAGVTPVWIDPVGEGPYAAHADLVITSLEQVFDWLP